MKTPRPKSLQALVLLSLVCAVAPALAQIQLEQRWPASPELVKINPKDIGEMVPGPDLPPEAKAPDSDPFVAVAGAPAVKGSLIYFADGDLVWRSLGKSRLMPFPRLGNQDPSLRSDVVSYGLTPTEFGSGTPHLSPDGHVLAFNPGTAFGGLSDGWHTLSSLYEWDLSSKRVVNLVPGNIASSDYYWSPDSRSIAYGKGDIRSYQLAELCIVNRLTRKTHNVVLSEGVSLFSFNPAKGEPDIQTFCWSSSTTLLFSGTPQAKNKDEHPHPNIYEAVQGKSRLLVSDAYAPVPSPDGRWIACFGWSDDAKQSLPGIYLFNRKENKRLLVRTLLRPARRNAITPVQCLRWTPDSHRLIVSEVSYEIKAKTGQGVVDVSLLDIPDEPSNANATWPQLLRLVVTVRVDDATSELPGVRFKPRQVSSDGSFLWMEALHTTGTRNVQMGKSELSVAIHEVLLQRINLSNGQVEVVARFNSNRLGGFEWQEEKP